MALTSEWFGASHKMPQGCVAVMEMWGIMCKGGQGCFHGSLNLYGKT